MSKLGDALAEYFQSKASLVRVTCGLWVTIAWLIMWLIYLAQRIVLWVFLLKSANAPVYIWASFWGVLPMAIILEQLERKSVKGE